MLRARIACQVLHELHEEANVLSTLLLVVEQKLEGALVASLKQLHLTNQTTGHTSSDNGGTHMRAGTTLKINSLQAFRGCLRYIPKRRESRHTVASRTSRLTQSMVRPTEAEGNMFDIPIPRLKQLFRKLIKTE